MEPYEFVEVCPGVWAALAVAGAGALGNAGFVDVGGETIVFDTGLTPQSGECLRAAAEQVAPVRAVVLSHWHLDHCVGAGTFADVPIVATASTRALIDERARGNLVRFREMDRSAYYIESERKASAASCAVEAADLRQEVHDLRVLESALHELELTLPSMTFRNELAIYGATRQIQLRTFGGGHTKSDSVLLVEGEGCKSVIFAGDLVVVAQHALFDGGNLEEWLATFDWIESQAVAHVVPGHGRVGTLDHLAALREYFEVVQASGSPDIPEPFREWRYPMSYERTWKTLRGV